LKLCSKHFDFDHGFEKPFIHSRTMEPSMFGAYVGMLMVLIAFASETRGMLSSRSLPYLLLMGVGEILLTIRASLTGEWPFAVLGAIWAAFALWSILKPPKLVEH
ncbi:MAG: hypothetical protein O2866_05625, partial [archaeon]|nr:hypothetical protein [archaeon]